MSIIIRQARQGDAEQCGRILSEAYQSLADHGFPRDFPSAAGAKSMVSMLLATPGFHGVVAEVDLRVVGVNFADLRSRIAGIGPIAVDFQLQNQGIGRALMRAVMDEAAAENVVDMRLVQVAYPGQPLSRYTGLGFQTRERLCVMQGLPFTARCIGYEVRRASKTDIDACNGLCRRVLGFDRAAELKDAIGQNVATVVEHMGRITGYTTTIGYFTHAVTETNQGLQALIGAAPSFPGPGFLLPERNAEVLKWCLDHGLRSIMPAMVMSFGLYNEPAGAYLPSTLY